MKKLDKLIEWLFYLFLFLLPWQTRLIIREGVLNAGHWEWGTYSLYAIDIVFIILLILFCLRFLIYRLISNSKFLIFKSPPSQDPVGAEQFLNSKSQISDKKYESTKIKDKFPVLGKMSFLVIVFLIFSFLSIFWAKDSSLAFYWWLRILQGAILFFLIQKIDFSLLKASLSLALAGLFQLALVGYQFLNQKMFASKWLGIAAQDSAQLGTSVVETTGGRIMRVYGSFSHPNIFAGFLIFLIFILFVLYAYAKKSWQRNFILFFSSLITIALFLTYSRGAWIALILNVILLGLVIFKKSAARFRLPFFEFFGLIFIIIIVFSSISLRDLVVRVEGSGRLEAHSLNERVLNFQRGAEIIRENFLLGTGIGNYTLALFEKYPRLSSWDYQPVANIYFLILAEIGLLGLVLFLLIIGFTLLTFGLNIYSPILISLLITGLFDHWLFSLSFGIILLWLALGLVWKRCQKYELTGEERFF